MKPKPAVIAIGHRGAAGHASENTLPSFAKALALGVRHIELDVYALEGELLVFHDDRLERTTNGQGYLQQQSLATVRALDAGGGQSIPTLAEVFALIDRRAGINIELKGSDTAALVADFVAAMRAQGWPDELILVSSFNHRELRRLARIDARIQLGALLVGLPLDNAAFAQQLGARSVHLSQEFIDAAFVADAHARGLRVYVFTTNHPEDIARMLALGVDGLFSDYPERVLAQVAPPANSDWP